MKTRQTSIDCYNQITQEGLLSKRREEVYKAIYKAAPCTTNEALKHIHSGSHGIGSRTTELRQLGVIYERGVRKCKITGRNTIEWDVTGRLPVTEKMSKEVRAAIKFNRWHTQGEKNGYFKKLSTYRII